MLPYKVLLPKISEPDVEFARALMIRLGITGNQPFEMLSMEHKEEVTNRLERILHTVANGSIVSLMINIIHRMYTTQGERQTTWLDSMTALTTNLLGEAEPDMNKLISENVLTSQPKKRVSNSQEKADLSQGLQCKDCFKFFKTAHTLSGHRRDIHSDVAVVHPCPECGKTFLHKRNLRPHLESHHQGKKLKCQLCDQTFAEMRGVTDHIIKSHNMMLKPHEERILKEGSSSGETVELRKDLKPEATFIGQNEHSNIATKYNLPPKSIKKQEVTVKLLKVENKMSQDETDLGPEHMGPSEIVIGLKSPIFQLN